MVGYVPCYLKAGGTANYKGGPNPEKYRAMGASGVTIATGCDLGQTDIATLKSYGLADAALLNILAPYIGLKKDAAIKKLHEAPLVISTANAEALDHAVHQGYLARYVIPVWDKEAIKPFAAIPANAQDVVMSVCFQKGVGGVRRDWPKLWNFLRCCQWCLASQELLTGFKEYTGRRKLEGKHLAAI